MHPTRSIIAFTTATGAGYGLLFVLGVAMALGLLPPERWLGLVGMGLALGLVTAGLLSSLLHLRRPERAWRALSQWRSSWLSREGVAALATYLPALGLAATWVLGEERPVVLGGLAALGAVATVSCTGMIYASLKPIPRWHHRLTVPVYLALALADGAVLAAFAVRATGHGQRWPALLALVTLPAAWALKQLWWHATDGAPPRATIGSATGLGRFGTVRLLEPPHTGSNYLLDEMGFRVARKHAAKLRRIALVLGLAVPWLLVAVSILVPSTPMAAFVLLVAAVSALTGTLVERWLFFAEAQHTSMLYYGMPAV